MFTLSKLRLGILLWICLSTMVPCIAVNVHEDPLSSSLETKEEVAVVETRELTINTSSKDAGIYSVLMDENYGNDSNLEVGLSIALYGVSRSLIQFDLPPELDGVEIISATLKLFGPIPWSGANASGEYIRACRVTQDWNEGTGSWWAGSTQDGVTWNEYNYYDGLATANGNWGTPGGDFMLTDSATTIVPPYPTTWIYLNWTVTNIVQTWVNDTYPNYGFLIKLDDESIPSSKGGSFPSREHPDIYGPKLEITYIPTMGWLNGTVTELETGLPLEGATVNATDFIHGYWLVTTTNASGRYRMQLPHGSYNASVMTPHHESQIALVQILPNGYTVQNFVLDRFLWELYIGVAGAGTTTPAPGGHMVEEGSTVEVEPFPAEGWIHDYWILDGEWIAPEGSFGLIIDGHHELIAVFAEEPSVAWTLSIEISGSGITAPEPGSHLYPDGIEVLVDALPEEGWMLDHWMLNTEYQEPVNPFPLIMDANHSLAAFFVEIPQAIRELTVEIHGTGTTEPGLGNHYYPENETVPVEAFPAEGWTLDHWILDSEHQSPDNPLLVYMNTSHVLRAVFVGPPPIASIESCNAFGDQTDSFNLSDIVYVIGDDYSPSASFDCYVVADVETWTDGLVIPSRVLGTVVSISSNIEGWIPPTIVWLSPNLTGHYDILVDVNSNGYYDEGVDALDDADIEVTDGFIVISEFPLHFILPTIMLLTALAVLVPKRKIFSRTPIHSKQL